MSAFSEFSYKGYRFSVKSLPGGLWCGAGIHVGSDVCEVRESIGGLMDALFDAVDSKLAGGYAGS